MNNKHHPGNSPLWEPLAVFIDCLSAHTQYFHWQYTVIGWDTLVTGLGCYFFSLYIWNDVEQCQILIQLSSTTPQLTGLGEAERA